MSQQHTRFHETMTSWDTWKSPLIAGAAFVGLLALVAAGATYGDLDITRGGTVTPGIYPDQVAEQTASE